MNLGLDEALILAADIKSTNKCDIVICPSFPLLYPVAQKIMEIELEIGAQDCHLEEKGAFTGDVSAETLKTVGCSWVIIGHSERRQHHSETNALVNKKAQAAHKAGLKTIICVGESPEVRKEGKTLELIKEQITKSLPSDASYENTVIAYEPIWAIGTGKTATTQDIEEVHNFIASIKENVKILYGGSVNEKNAAEIFSTKNVGGVLVGGASLKADSFNKIIEAAS